jgi:hypothetical protein
MTPDDEHHSGNCAAGSPNERAGPLFGLAARESVHHGSYDRIAALREPLGYARQSTAGIGVHPATVALVGVCFNAWSKFVTGAGHRETATTAWLRTRAVRRR